MTNYYEIRDRVPCEEIDALTVEAARVWLERNGWTLDADETAPTDGIRRTYYVLGDSCVAIGSKDGVCLIDASRRMCELVTEGAAVAGKRAHVVIAEIRAIADWQRRCAEWVPPKDGEVCNHCWTCDASLASPWEVPGSSFPFMPTCPTCSNKRCPRATDHRNGCSGSNEPGQEGSRYA